MGVEYFKCTGEGCDEILCDCGEYFHCDTCHNGTYCSAECGELSLTKDKKHYVCANCMPECVCCEHYIVHEDIIFCVNCKTTTCEECFVDYFKIDDDQPTLKDTSPHPCPASCVSSCKWCGPASADGEDCPEKMCTECWSQRDRLVPACEEGALKCMPNLCKAHRHMHRCGAICGLPERIAKKEEALRQKRAQFVEEHAEELKEHMLKKLKKNDAEVTLCCKDFDGFPM